MATAFPQETEYLLVAAIDIGTSCSGYAFSYTSRPTNVYLNRNWPNGSSEAFKCPTSLLTNPDGTLKSFGFEAEEEFIQAEEDFSEMDGTSQFQLYRRFKMVLSDENSDGNYFVTSLTGHVENAVKIFGMALRYLKDHMMQTISASRRTDSGLELNDILWVITVPAFWTERAKYFMREAATEAGMISKPDSSHLMIALEPEAASSYYRTFSDEYSVSLEVIKNFKPGEKMLIIDAGGGTVDIAAHEVVDSTSVKEIAPPSGGPWGGVTVDESFENLLSCVLCKDFVDHLKSKASQTWLNVMAFFEASKRSHKRGPLADMKINIPFQLDKECKKFHRKSMTKVLSEASGETLTFRNGILTLPAYRAKQLYQESIDNIVRHLNELLKNVNLHNLQYIVLVGGYGQSAVLQNSLEEAFRDKYSILCPLSPQVAIVKGAVLFGHMPRQVKSRLAVRTFGCAANLKFDSAIHHPKRKYKSQRDGMFRCQGTFKKFVTIGDELKNPELRTHTVHPKSKDESEVTILFYASNKNDVIYCDENGVKKIGEVTLICESGSFGEDIELEITFGHTEILVMAKDSSRGHEIPVKAHLKYH